MVHNWHFIGLRCHGGAVGPKDDWKKARISVRKNCPQEYPQLAESNGKLSKQGDLDLLHGLAKQALRDAMWQSILDACPFSVAPDVDADISTDVPLIQLLCAVTSTGFT